MLIRSQDKEILANMEGPIAIEILSDGKGHATMYWKDSYALGTYSSKEKAIKVPLLCVVGETRVMLPICRVLFMAEVITRWVPTVISKMHRSCV
jgi:hypothetical protein